MRCFEGAGHNSYYILEGSGWEEEEEELRRVEEIRERRTLILI